MRRLNDKLGYEAPQRADLVAVRAAIAVVTAAAATAQSTADAAVTTAAAAQATADSAASDAATAIVNAQAAQDGVDLLAPRTSIARGTATLVAGTKAVLLDYIPAGAIVTATMHTPSGTLGATYKTVIVANTSLTITSVTAALAVQLLDTSVIHYTVFETP